MRFATYESSGAEHSAVLDADGDRLHPLDESLTALVTRGDPDALRAAGERALAGPAGPRLAEVRLLAPFQAPSIRDFVGFEAHIEGVSKSLDGLEHVPEVWYRAPAFYFTNPHASYGAHDGVPVPAGCRVLDFELEVGAVIGRSGRNLTPDQAGAHILGYLVFNDWSARDLQKPERELGLGFSKGKDFANTLGPWLVTADEVEQHRDADGYLDLAMSVSLNGGLIGRDTLANASWTFEEMIAYATRDAWVRPGDILGSGTCGWGALAEHWGRNGERTPPPLQPGDEVTLTVEGLGTVSNRILPGPEQAYLPRARKRGRSPRP
ncbi:MULTISPECIES: fumarylacetoacetate hydrolase family protein [Streptacidiphilus]|uniref:Fumarylacetoacetate hydrolase family protein n=1 Tax=Streptacidiphilus cavernicola TaxID=3342716 RepID=A0ABV6UHT3_9ACTN|nr:fumarylacetoacetate hydrolase family protein [Streptacidiphilus jeojiense]